LEMDRQKKTVGPFRHRPEDGRGRQCRESVVCIVKLLGKG
jgi:hypothetical protein